MDKRAEKLRQCLQMVMLRLRDSQELQRVEVETPKGVEVLKPEAAEPNMLRSDWGRQLPLAELSSILAEYAGCGKGKHPFCRTGDAGDLGSVGAGCEIEHEHPGRACPSAAGRNRHPPAVY